MDLTPKDHAEQVALFRSQVIGNLAHCQWLRGELARALRDLSQKKLRPPGSTRTRTFSVPTLERWLYAYREGGLAALRPDSRRQGHALGLTDEQRELLLDIRREHGSASSALIRRTLVADGRLSEDTVSPPTLRRLFVDHGLDRVPLVDGEGRKTRLRWQAERPGALWQGDVCHGPSLVVGEDRLPLRIHALLDDASRYVVALEAHSTERELDMIGVLVAALRRYPPPDVLYLDNGSTYRGDALRLACERLGITLLHPRPGDAPARGKMERFWRTLRQGCLDFLGPVTTLHEVNVRLLAFLDQHYHGAPHGGLFGRDPGAVWAEGAGPDRKPVTEEQLAEALTVRERRRVRRDTTGRHRRHRLGARPGLPCRPRRHRRPVPGRTPRRRPGSSTRASACRSTRSIPSPMPVASARRAATTTRPRATSPSTRPRPSSIAPSVAAVGPPRRSP